ncbi:cytochrome C [bacterium]|nr:cytochrome C [bacterium]MBU1957838.1 cytochrome C [bacterium]
MSIFLFMAIFTTQSFADVANGQRIYKKNLKQYCAMSASKFASTHSQDEWEEIYDAGEFVNEVKKICPMLKSAYQGKWTEDLYKFSYQYANDSDHIANY